MQNNFVSINESPAKISFIIPNNNNNIMIDKSSIQMDLSITSSKYQETNLHSHELLINKNNSNKINNNNNSVTTDITQSSENIQATTTTGNVYSDEQEINAWRFSEIFLNQLQVYINEFEFPLVIMDISTKHQRLMQDCRRNPQAILSRDVFDMFFSILKHVQQETQSYDQSLDMCLIGEELNETTEQRILAPTDEIDGNMDAQIHATIEPDVSMLQIEKNIFPCTSSFKLSQLLLEEMRIIKDKILCDLEFIHKPKQFWHSRTINCLAKKDCPPLQSTIERKYIVLKEPNLSDYNKNDLFVHVQLLTYDGKIHPSKFIVPPKTTVTGQTLEDLTIHNDYGFNSTTKTILYPLKLVKHNDGEMQLKMHMFNAYKTSKVEGLNRTSGSIRNNKSITNEFHDYIKNELDKICKIRINLCQRTKNGWLECISKPIDTNFIKESKGIEELKTIDASNITPVEPCQCGNESINVPLNAQSEKAGFVVKINERQLALHEFFGVNRNSITIYPPPKTSEMNDFHLNITKINILKTIESGLNPYDYPIEDPLLDTRIKYQDSDKNCQHRPKTKKRKTQ